MAKILLVKCSQHSRDNDIVTPPLGLLYLASVLRKKGHKVGFIDTRLGPDGFDRCIGKAALFGPDIVGLSAVTPEADNLHFLARAIKQGLRNCSIVAGGPHPTSCPEEVIGDRNIDFAVIGEGEETFPELVEAIESGSIPEGVKGIAFSRDEKYNFTGFRTFMENLDNLPFPAWDLVDLDDYKNYYRFSGAVGKKRKYMPIFTSRGCPYDCIFCHKIFGKAFRPRTPENVLGEMEALIAGYGVRDFEIIDDIFNFDRKRAESILDMIIARDLKVQLSFINGLRSDILDYGFLKKMKAAGTYQLSIAVETSSKRLQGLIRKNLNLDKIKEAIEQAAGLKIFTHGLFMLGLPTETKEEILGTIKFAADSRLNISQFVIANPFKGTELHSLRERNEGEERYADYDFQTGNFNFSAVSAKELFRLQKLAYRKFYFSRRHFFDLLLFFPNKRNLFKGAWLLVKRILRHR